MTTGFAKPGPQWRRTDAALMSAVAAMLLLAGFSFRAFEGSVAQARDVIDRADALEAVMVHGDLAPWTRIRGVGSAAASLQVNLSLIAQGVDLSTDPSGGSPSALLPVERDLVRLLQNSPTEVGAWLHLAAVRWDQGQGASAEQAWQMAALLAPREAAAVTSRLPLAFLHWRDLGEASRRTAARDVRLMLSEALPLRDVETVLADMPRENRQIIASDLIAMQGLRQSEMEKLGLLGP